MRIYAFFMVTLIFSAFQVQSQFFETSIEPIGTDLIKSAKYRLWVPQTKEVKGIIVRQHGCGANAKDNGLNHANDLQWQTLAQKHSMALMGTELIANEACSQWFNIEGGSARTFIEALKKLAKISNHPELEDVPWALWGHSGGAYWCTDILFNYPSKILCAVPRSGGHAFAMLWNPSVKEVPVLWMAGKDDLVDGLDYVRAMTYQSFQSYRRYGAIWSVAIDPAADHGNENGRSFAIRWMDDVLVKRLPKEGHNPVRIDTTNYWLGNLETKEIKAANEVKENRNKWVWLPDEAVAKNWQEFVKTGWVTDMSPPPTPFCLKIERTFNGLVLSWKSKIDMESGLKQFNVYRNDQFIGVVEGQTHNFHDAPEPVDVKFKYYLKQSDSKGYLRVESINFQGIKSNISEATYVSKE